MTTLAKPKLALALASLLMATAVAACGSPVPATPTPTGDGPLTAEQILERADQALMDLTSVRWVSEITELSRVMPEGFIDDDYSPKFDRMEIERTLDSEYAAFHLKGGRTAETITVDNRQFNRVDDEPWRETVMRLHELMPAQASVLRILPLADPALVGETDVQGVAVYHIQGERRIPESADEPPLQTDTVDLYIRKDDFLPLRSEEVIHKRISNENGQGEIVWKSVTTYSDFNAPIAIERPTDIKDVPFPDTVLGFPSATHLITLDTDRTLSEDEWADLIQALESHLTDLGGEGVVVEQDGSRGLTIATEDKAGTIEMVYDRVRERARELDVELTLVGVTRQ